LPLPLKPSVRCALLLAVCLLQEHARGYAQIKVPFEEKKISRLKDGASGFLIEDYGYFRDKVLETLSAADSLLASIPDREELKRKADSLFGILQTKGELALAKQDLSVMSLFPLGEEEPKVLANLLFTLNRLGGTKSLSYAVKMGDTLDITYKISKGHGWDEFEVIEGKEVRFTSSRNPKNKDIAAQIVVEADGIITVNLENKGVLRSKGTFTLTKRSAKKNLALRYVCDTVYTEVKAMKRVVDTFTEPLFTRVINLSSKRDITSPSFVTVDLPFTPGRDYLAWGFWLGSTLETRQSWDGLLAMEAEADPLTSYAMTELKRKGFFLLPEEENPDIRFAFSQSGNAAVRDFQGKYPSSASMAPSANTRANYGTVIIRKKSKSAPSVKLKIENQSRVYDYQTLVNVVGIYADSHEEEVALVEKTCVEYVMLSLS
jgi:hypothetical protein